MATQKKARLHAQKRMTTRSLVLFPDTMKVSKRLE
jgi:hypothetical protein